MSLRRRFLNLVTRKSSTGVYSLHHIDLQLPRNNLFVRVPRWFWRYDDAKKMNRIQLGKLRLRFQPALVHNSICSFLPGRRSLDCVALSESKAVFLDCYSNGAFLYDDDDRCVVTLPNLLGSKPCSTIRLSSIGGSNDHVFVMEDCLSPEKTFQFQVLVHRKNLGKFLCHESNRWECEDLPPPPYVSDAGFSSGAIDSYCLVNGEVCVSTKRIGTYCFNMASGKWSKAGDWTLPFSG